jgi:hypothetical protein
MQCTNCQFHNMPGSDNCGRCGSSLRLATAVIDVHPPRAGRFRKSLRRTVPVNRAVLTARAAVESVREVSGIQHLAAAAPWGLLLRSALPGWSHFYAGQRVRGHLFLWGTLAFLLPGLLVLGTFWGSFLLGMAFSVHSWAALDIVTQIYPHAGTRDRMARSIMVSLALFAGVYVPVGIVLLRVADPTLINYAMPSFQVGDVVLVNHHTTLRPGHVVLYRIPDYTFPEEGSRNRLVHMTGERIDRILAGPGDRVVWEKGRLTVNGAASDRLPLNPGGAPARFTATVPEGCVLILPTTTPYMRPKDPETAWLTLSVVPEDQLIGRAYARSHPLTRFTLFR